MQQEILTGNYVQGLRLFQKVEHRKSINLHQRRKRKRMKENNAMKNKAEPEVRVCSRDCGLFVLEKYKRGSYKESTAKKLKR